jgi:hypothetical protein
MKKVAAKVKGAILPLPLALALHAQSKVKALCV